MKLFKATGIAAAAVMLIVQAACGTADLPDISGGTMAVDDYTYILDNSLTQPEESVHEGYVLAASVDGMELYLDTDTTRFILHDGQGGVWHSSLSEEEAEADETAYGEYRRAMTSLLSMYCCDQNAESGKEYASTRHSVNDGSYTVRYVKNEAGEQIGFRIDFEFPDLWITVPIVVTVGGGVLTASVPMDEIVNDAPEITVIQQMSILPHFGSAPSNAEGYILVPDGCGGIINFNNGSISSGALEVQVYGEDAAFVEKRSGGNEEKTLLPVFGMKNGERAFLAVVSGCDAYANIMAEVSGVNTDRNYVYSRFRFRETDSFPLKDQGGTAQDYTVIDIKDRSLPDATVEYRFLSGGGYNGMADVYADYLAEKYGMARTDKEIDYVLTLYGAVRKKRSVAGIPATVTEKLTTFDNAKEMLEMLKEKGLEAAPTVRYRYALKSQVRTAVPEKPDILSSLGGSRGYAELSEYVVSLGGGAYMAVNSAAVKESLFGSGYIRNVMNLKAYQYQYDVLTGYQVSGSKSCLYMPDIVLSKMKKYFSSVSKNTVTRRVALETVANRVYSSFGNTYFSREDTKAYWQAVFSDADNKGVSLMLDSAAAYAVPYADIAVDSPTQSNHYSMVDADVPFYQLALSRFVPCVSQPINLTSNPQMAFLRCMRSGSIPQFAFIAGNPAVLQGTELEWLFATDFGKWSDDAVSMITQWKTVSDAKAGTPVAGYYILKDDVTVTVYGNGTAVAVNTGNDAFAINGIEIPAMDWRIVPEIERDIEHINAIYR